MLDPDSQREQSRRRWGEMAPAFRDRNEWMMRVTGLDATDGGPVPTAFAADTRKV